MPPSLGAVGRLFRFGRQAPRATTAAARPTRQVTLAGRNADAALEARRMQRVTAYTPRDLPPRAPPNLSARQALRLTPGEAGLARKGLIGGALAGGGLLAYNAYTDIHSRDVESTRARVDPANENPCLTVINYADGTSEKVVDEACQAAMLAQSGYEPEEPGFLCDVLGIGCPETPEFGVATTEGGPKTLTDQLLDGAKVLLIIGLLAGGGYLAWKWYQGRQKVKKGMGTPVTNPVTAAPAKLEVKTDATQKV